MVVEGKSLGRDWYFGNEDTNSPNHDLQGEQKSAVSSIVFGLNEIYLSGEYLSFIFWSF